MFAPLPYKYNDRILCYYINSTKQIQIARILDIPNWFFERVVFPKQRLCFEAIVEAHLEIFYEGALARATLSVDNPRSKSDGCRTYFYCKIPCNLLRVNEGMPYVKRSYFIENGSIQAIGERSAGILLGLSLNSNERDGVTPQER